MADGVTVNIEFDPELLEQAIAEENLSQAELSRMAGFAHRNTVNKILKGSREATATDLLRLSTALNRDPKDFAKN